MTAAFPSTCDVMTPSAALPPTQRRCFVTGEIKEKTALIRFVLDPQDCVVPDLTGRLGGRGLWVSAAREALELAIKKNLFSKAAKTKATVPSHLLDQVTDLLARRCLSLLGLVRSAGAVVAGLPSVERALSEGPLAAVFVASDAGGDCRKKLSRANPLLAGFTREALGAALGCAPVAALGLRQHTLTQKFLIEWTRWQGVSAPECGSKEPLVDSEQT